MILAEKTYRAFDGAPGAISLHEACMNLISEQKKIWPDLRRGCEALKNMEVRNISCSGFSVRVQHNPGRITSTMASVEQSSVAMRPCFLCPDNLPTEQKGVLYRDEYLILCNPMPVVSGHLTIAHRAHKPQAIVEHVDDFLGLMRDFGHHWTLMYNGPKCGASAPDHLHFQAIPSGVMPVEKDVEDRKKLATIAIVEDVCILRAKGLGRQIIVIESMNLQALTMFVAGFMADLKMICDADDEPMVNVCGSFDGDRWQILIFPRAKHRPDAFYREGDDRIVVSPAIAEMGGILVTPVKKDFDGMHAAIVEGIYQEVSLDEAAMDRSIAAIRAAFDIF